MNNEILFKPNGLILATTNNTITSTEYKLYDTLLQRCQITKDSQWRKAEVSREDMKSIIKHDANATVSEIKATFDKFQSIKIKFKLGKKQVNGVLIAEYVYDELKDVFTCSMSENVFIALMTYKDIGYSPIDLKLVRQARGFYTQKIYGLLRMWSRQNQLVTKIYTIDQIKDVCDINSEISYGSYSDLKKRVLLPAIKEINEKLNMKVEYKEIKKIRRVVEIEFNFVDYEPRKYDFDKDELIESIIENDLLEPENLKETTTINSIDYMHLIDCNLNESVHVQFMKDFLSFKDYLTAVKLASEKTLYSTGSKTINKRNYKYFKTTLENLVPISKI